MAALLVAVLAQDVRAAPPGDAPGQAEARALYLAGEVAYGDGRFASALARFREAYALSKRPQLLYNIALCEDRLGRNAEALDDYSRFLVETSDDAARPQVEARVRVLRARLADGSAGAIEAAPLVAATAPPSKRPVYKRGWFWGVIGGVAAVGVGLGVGLGLGLRSDGFSSNLPARGPGAR